MVSGWLVLCIFYSNMIYHLNAAMFGGPYSSFPEIICFFAFWGLQRQPIDWEDRAFRECKRHWEVLRGPPFITVLRGVLF